MRPISQMKKLRSQGPPATAQTPHREEVEPEVFSPLGPKAAQLAHRIHLPLPPPDPVSVRGDFTVTITNVIPTANIFSLLTAPRLSTKYFESLTSKFFQFL